MVDYTKQINETNKDIKNRRDSIINTVLTLCSGTVVISATLLEKFLVYKTSKILLFCSWGSLIISILCGLKTKFSIIHFQNRLRKAMLKKMAENDLSYIIINPTKSENFFEFVFYLSFVFGLIFLLLSAITSV